MTTLDTAPPALIRTNRRVTSAPRRIPLSRIVRTEIRKMFDTRSGFWLVASIGIISVLSTAAVIVFTPDDQVTYSSFATAIGFPMTIVLPVIAILSVTGEWSQRSGLTTFTLIPHRSRVITAKAIACIGVGVAAIPFALGIGALGNVVGSAMNGADPVWNLSVTNVLTIILANVLGLLMGFMLGLLTRTSTGAIVAYFVYALVLPTIAVILATSQHWFRVLQPWLDFKFAQGRLFDGTVSAQQWANLGTTGLVWLIIPLALGLLVVTRAEVK